MKKTFLFLSLILIAMTVGGCSLYGNKAADTTAPQTVDSTTNPVPAPVANQAVPAVSGQPETSQTVPTVNGQKFAIDIKNFAFSPATVTVKIGDTVTWTNNDSAPHQVQGGPVDSPVFSRGDSFSFTFTETGTFNYICSLHPAMKGQIIVQ